MAKIKSRKHHSPTQLVVLAASIPFISHAAETIETENVAKLPTISVHSDKENPYKVEESASPKLTQPLVDTTKTITIISKELISDQGAGSLVEALRNTPGITLQLGENGNTSTGDTFQMRGFSTQNSLLVDGIRDLGAQSRDVFNLEQIEIAKGAAGAEVGRTNGTGYINLITKQANLTDSQTASIRASSAEHLRLTADINKVINESTAFRINVLGEGGHLPDKDVVTKDSYGLATSLGFGLNSPTRLHLSTQHLRQENTPIGGTPTIGLDGFSNKYQFSSSPSFTNNSSLRDRDLTILQRSIRASVDPALNAKYQNLVTELVRNAPKVDYKNFYGNSNDLEKVDSSSYSAKIESDLSEHVKFTNITRYAETKMERTLTSVSNPSVPQATITINADQTFTAPNTTALDRFIATPYDQWTITRGRQAIARENKVLANQSILNFDFNTGSIEHNAVFGIDLVREEQISPALVSNGVTTTPANLYNPNPNDTVANFYKNGNNTSGLTQTAAAYVFNTLKFLDGRIQLNGGLRYDYYDTETRSYTASNNTNSITGWTNDHFLSWSAGALAKPTDYSSVYATVSRSVKPQGIDFSISNSASSTQNPDNDPEEMSNYEVGTKWELLDKKLALNLALYRSENENQFTQDPLTNVFTQDGKTRVDGVEFSTLGQITPNWNISAGVAYMKVKQLDQQSVSTDVVTNERTVTTQQTQRWSPEWTGSLWTTYTLDKLRAGVGARYIDTQHRITNGSDTSTTIMSEIPSYSVFDALIGYTISNNASLNLNVYNLADKRAIQSLNNNGSRVTFVQPRYATLTFNYKF